MTGRLKNKLALITGGSGGMALGIADCYLHEGASVILADINESDLEKELVSQNSQASFINLDVTNEKDWQKNSTDIKKKFGNLDILINNAGVAMSKSCSVEDEPLEDWRRVIDINLTGCFLGLKYAFKAMKEKGGSIINMSSAGGLVGGPFSSAYAASKAGVTNLTKAVALDATTQHYNIRVNSVHPGAVKTPMTEGEDAMEVGKTLTKLIPIGYMADPHDIGEICVYLGSDASKYATGAAFVIDGGYTAQ